MKLKCLGIISDSDCLSNPKIAACEDCFLLSSHCIRMFVCVFSLHAELFSDKSNTHEFVNLVKELALPGELTQNRSYDFEFMQVEKPYESYVGANVRLRLVKTL